MIDPISIVITVIITVLVILLTIIGIEIYKTLKQFQKTLEKVNEILDDTQKLTNPIAQFGSLVENLTSGAGLVKFASKFLEKVFSARNEEK